MPWLAAHGPLAYTPESPPATDYFFQYSWILPEIFDAKVNKRCHYYFGAPIRQSAARLFGFWRQARNGQIKRIYSSPWVIAGDKLSVPPRGISGKLRPYDDSDPGC